jgi:mannosylfructose-phosphate synthase
MRSERLQYGLINSHYWDAGLAGQALANRFGNVHVHTPHSIGAWKRDQMDCSPQEEEERYNFSTRIREEKVIYDECDSLIATTPVQRDILAGDDYDTPLDKIHVIPPGYDDERFFPVSLATRQLLKQQLGLKGTIVLTLGRIAKNKGYDLLLRAMPTVFKRVRNAKLVLAIGSTNPTPRELAIRTSLVDLANELRIADRVVFGDYIHDDDLPAYYRAADVFALSSRYEPFGMTAVEAMACGTPAVVTTEGGLCEQVAWGIEALHANPFDPEAFGHALVSVLQQPTVSSRLSKFGPRKARSCFTWTGIAQQLLECLETHQTDLETGCVLPLQSQESQAEEALWIA